LCDRPENKIGNGERQIRLEIELIDSIAKTLYWQFCRDFLPLQG
jgi:hypothetical protein